jgi:iron complex transport system substrate-binding protein
MRAFAFASAISLAAVASGGVEAAPRRAVSLNLCTDELLLMLARPEQILSVTHLSQQAAETPLWRQALRYRRNDGSLASVAAWKPDLVVTMGAGARDRLRIAERLGLRILDLPYPNSIEDIERSLSTLADALGDRTRARPLLGAIGQLKRSAPRAGKDTIWLGGGGRSLGQASLGASWLSLAGLRQRKLPGDRATLEQLLVRPPAVLVRSDYRSGQYSGEQRWLRHPLAGAGGGARTILTDGRRWTCMGPLMIEEISRLKGLAR